MPIYLVLLYLITYYLTPYTVFGPLAAFRPELIIGLLLVVISIPRLVGRSSASAPQFLALAGMSAAVFLSMAIGAHWVGGGLQAILEFIPAVVAFMVTAIHIDSPKKVRMTVLMLLFVCLWVIGHGALDTVHTSASAGPIISEQTGALDMAGWDASHPYVLAMRSNEQWLHRIRGLGQISDPNDLGQLIVCTIPLLFVFWKPKRLLRNVVCVMAPAAMLIAGAFLTHSRGALIALAVVAFLFLRKRIGLIMSAISAVLLFLAVGFEFSGGREVSASAGSDRTGLWGDGLQLLKSHPLFGVGYKQMQDYAGLTAHNSLVVVAAELGTLGLFSWMLFLVPSIRDAAAVGSSRLMGLPGGGQNLEEAPIGPPTERVADDAEDISRIGRAILLSVVALLVTGFFLSRAYALTFFVLMGMGKAIYEMALTRGMVPPRMQLFRSVRLSAVWTVALIFGLYVGLRIYNLAVR